MENKSEAKIQQEIVVFFRNNYCRKGLEEENIIFSVPNEAAYKNKKFLMTGLMTGVSDLVVVMKERVVFVEVKDHKGKQSERQKAFERVVNNLGHEYILVRSLEDFKSFLLH